jgi:hypothetical protein
MQNLTLEQILNRTESISYSKKFKYSEQYGINGKPAIVSTNENLKIYPLKIKLHNSFCNPQTIIDEIEQKAQNREIINYFQNGKYIGNYVISDFNVKIIQKISDIIVLAEININLLEKPDTNFGILSKIFEKPKINLSKTNANSKKIKSFLNKADLISNTNLYNNILNNIPNNLSLEEEKFLKNIVNMIIEDIKTEGLLNSQKIINNYTKNFNEIYIKDYLEKIPKILIKTSLRQAT